MLNIFSNHFGSFGCLYLRFKASTPLLQLFTRKLQCCNAVKLHYCVVDKESPKVSAWLRVDHVKNVNFGRTVPLKSWQMYNYFLTINKQILGDYCGENSSCVEHGCVHWYIYDGSSFSWLFISVQSGQQPTHPPPPPSIWDVTTILKWGGPGHVWRQQQRLLAVMSGDVSCVRGLWQARRDLTRGGLISSWCHIQK